MIPCDLFFPSFNYKSNFTFTCEVQRKQNDLGAYSFIICLHLRTFFHSFLKTEERKRERNTSIGWFPSYIHPDKGLNTQPGYVP